jgi:hypothetical protein
MYSHYPARLAAVVLIVLGLAGALDRRQSRLLFVGQVLGIFPQRPPGTLDLLRFAGAAAFATTDGVPHLPAHPVEGVSDPRDQVVRVEAVHRPWGTLGDHGCDPFGGVGRDVCELPGPLVAEVVEERGHGGLVPTLGGPHQAAGVVIDDQGQIPLALAVGDLVDADTS